MIIFWRGQGLWVLGSVVLAMGAALLGIRAMGVDLATGDFLAGRTWPIGGAIGAAGLVNLIYGLRANRGRSDLGYDRATGMRMRIGTRHSLYGVPMEIWGAVFLVLSVFMFATMHI